MATRKEVSTPSALPGISACLALFGIAGRAKYLGFPSIVAFCTASSSWWRRCFVRKEDVSVVFSGFFKKEKNRAWSLLEATCKVLWFRCFEPVLCWVNASPEVLVSGG